MPGWGAVEGVLGTFIPVLGHISWMAQGGAEMGHWATYSHLQHMICESKCQGLGGSIPLESIIFPRSGEGQTTLEVTLLTLVFGPQ